MMGIKSINQEMNKWQNAICSIRKGDRSSFIELVKIGGGDHIYAGECTNKEAIDQCHLAIDQLKNVSMVYI